MRRSGACQAGWGPGLGPIFSSKGRRWILVGHRGHPVSSVNRAQFMVAPSLAATARSAQRRAAGAVVADLEGGRG
eukprot:9342331-Pyramimonas_sp.AAC.1